LEIYPLLYQGRVWVWSLILPFFDKLTLTIKHCLEDVGQKSIHNRGFKSFRSFTALGTENNLFNFIPLMFELRMGGGGIGTNLAVGTSVKSIIICWIKT